MSGKQSVRKTKSWDIENRGKPNLGQKNARLEKEKASDLARLGEKSRKSQKKQRARNQ
jgi:hypothetical protein